MILNMEITLNKTRSRVTDTLEVVNGDYKVIANVVVEAGAVKQLNGYVTKATTNGEFMGDNIGWNASKRNDKWGVSFDWVSNEENDVLTDLVVAVVVKIAAEYEAAE